MSEHLEVALVKMSSEQYKVIMFFSYTWASKVLVVLHV